MFRKKLLCTMLIIVSLLVCACGGGSGATGEKKEPSSSFGDSSGGGFGSNQDWNSGSEKEDDEGTADNTQNGAGAGTSYSGGNLSGGETGSSYMFLEEDAEYVVYDEAALAAFVEELKQNTAEYGYDKLFDIEKSLEGLTGHTPVATHPYSALDSNGNLTKDHYYEVVKKNTEEYLKTKPMMIKAVDDATMREVCEVIVDVVNEVLSTFPDIDRERVYCTLAQVKVGYHMTSTAYAYVDEEMFVHVNKSFSNLAQGADEDGFYRIMIHETMHLIQIGCLCEHEQINGRRLGVSYYYNDWETQYADWTWLGEGSAERMSNLYTGKRSITYPENIGVIQTMDVLAALREELPANYVETICYYDDVDKVFSLFDACTREEVCRMMYAFEIALEEPGSLETDYPRLYGTSWTEDEAEKVKFTLKNMALTTLTKQFFCELCNVIRENNLTKNDVMFLLDLYESSMGQMTRMGLNRYQKYSTGFAEWYRPVRESFFGLFENLSKADFNTYEAGNGKTGINASLSWLPESKINVIMKKQEEILQKYKIK